MEAISGTRRTIRERVDGSLVVQIEIDPPHVGEFHRLFPKIDMPVALAPLVAHFEQAKPVAAQTGTNLEDKKGGELAKLAGIFCQQPEFWGFAGVENEQQARDWILSICDIQSRRELDHNVVAAHIFHEHIRKPYAESRK